MKSGRIHWLAQRITAIVLIPLILWFLLNFVSLMNYNYNETLIFFSSKINSYLFLIMMIITIYHSKLGMQTILEDYIYSEDNRNKIIKFINFLSYVLIVFSILSICIIQIST